jgi:hypothetical protein
MRIEINRYPYTPNKMINIQSTNNSKCLQKHGNLGILFITGGNIKRHNYLGRQFYGGLEN